MKIVISLLTLALALGACLSDSDDGSAPCTQTLVESCAGHCPNTEQDARDAASSRVCSTGGYGVAVAGQCGVFRYVKWSGAFGGATYYYDAQDQLVGAEFRSDTNEYCDKTSFEVNVGTVPDCVRQEEVDLCKMN